MAERAELSRPQHGGGLRSSRCSLSGRLHLCDIETEKIYTKVTNQGDSEVLLVEKNTMYYRNSKRLYSAPITAKGIGPPRLLATAEEVRDAHWAFIKH